MVHKLILAAVVALGVTPAVAQTPASHRQVDGITWNPSWYQDPPPACMSRALNTVATPALDAYFAMTKVNYGQPVVGIGPLAYSISPDGKTETCEGNILVVGPSGVGVIIQHGQLVVSPAFTNSGYDNYSHTAIEWLRQDPGAPTPENQDVITVPNGPTPQPQ